MEPHFQIILNREEGLDVIELKVEVSSNLFAFDEIRKVQSFQQKIHQQLITSLGLHAKISLIESKSLGRTKGEKVKRVLDLRKL